VKAIQLESAIHLSQLLLSLTRTLTVVRLLVQLVLSLVVSGLNGDLIVTFATTVALVESCIAQSLQHFFDSSMENLLF
jgi:hypothetical protein